MVKLTEKQKNLIYVILFIIISIGWIKKIYNLYRLNLKNRCVINIDKNKILEQQKNIESKE
ncbi:MAG TPA: hypothetical protein PLM75_00040 [bacterium]|nr:hypothetical protein [bacterium]